MLLGIVSRQLRIPLQWKGLMEHIYVLFSHLLGRACMGCLLAVKGGLKEVGGSAPIWPGKWQSKQLRSWSLCILQDLYTEVRQICIHNNTLPDSSSDLTTYNILFHVSDQVHRWPVWKVYSTLGEPEIDQILTINRSPSGPHAPREVVLPLDATRLSFPPLPFLEENIIVTDFGQSFDTKHQPQ